MPFEPVFETINVNLRKGTLTDQIKVECRTDIPTEAVSKIINVSAFPYVGRTETADGQLRYGGKIVFFICYEDNGEIKKCECGAEFTGALTGDGISPNCRAVMRARAEKSETSLSGVKLSVSAYVTVTAEVSECRAYNALTGGENVITDKKEVSYTRSYGVREAAYAVEDEFEVNYRVAEVLSHRAAAVVTSVQCGVGVIIVDGEVYFSAIFLQSGEKKDIIRENRTIPYRMEIECEDAMPAFTATAHVSEKSFKIDVGVDDTNGVSTVNAEVSLGFTGEAFSTESAALASDAFSVDENVELIKEEAECCRENDVRSLMARVTGRAAIDEIPVGAYLSAACNEKAEVASAENVGGGVKITGALTITGIFCDAEGKVFSRKAETPFETVLDCILPDDCEFEILAAAGRAQAKIVSLTEIEVEADVAFTLYPREKCRLSCIKEIKSAGEKTKTDCAISVYIPAAGEELWTLAKRLNISPENLVATNRDLQFPLSGKERIVVYRCR